MAERMLISTLTLTLLLGAWGAGCGDSAEGSKDNGGTPSGTGASGTGSVPPSTGATGAVGAGATATVGGGGSGATGAVGPTGGATEPAPTDGCNATSWPESGPYTIDVGGTQREYIVTLPDGYAGTQPMKLIFVYHGLTGTMEQTASGFWGYFGMQGISDGSAIFVAPQGLPSEPGGDDYGWRNTDSEDTAFHRAMIERFTVEYCIDAQRIFTTGMSFGGVMSNSVGCEVGDLVRAIAPIAGAGPGFGQWGGPGCVGQVAALLIHGSADTTVSLDMGLESRDHWIEANGCSTDSTPVAPTQYCVSYSGCAAGYPVIWCEHEGGHTVPDFSAQTIWDFFQQF